jgi:hypothetical protein
MCFSVVSRWILRKKHALPNRLPASSADSACLICTDAFVHSVAHPCALCQEARELDAEVRGPCPARHGFRVGAQRALAGAARRGLRPRARHGAARFHLDPVPARSRPGLLRPDLPARRQHGRRRRPGRRRAGPGLRRGAARLRAAEAVHGQGL